MSEVDVDFLRQWVGRERLRDDSMDVFRTQALLAALDRPRELAAGDELPACSQWLYFLDTPTASQTGRDGHPHNGEFLPPVPLPRRMWAAGEFEYRRPLRLGEMAQQRSVVTSVNLKQGRSGTLVFVGIRLETSQRDELCLVEDQTLVYREMPPGPQPLSDGQSAPLRSDWSRHIEPDPVLLLRYSALTYNGHRIHYDRDYATTQEHFPALVVHGPLLATLLASLLQDHLPQRRVRRFKFKAIRPTFDDVPFLVCGESTDDGQVQLWTNADGLIGMRASAELTS